MSTITVDEAREMLPGLLAGLPAGSEIVITDGSKPVAKLVSISPPPVAPRVPGSAVGILTVVSDDDDHLTR